MTAAGFGRLVLGVALLATLVWFGLVGSSAIEEAEFRSDLRADGTRYTARVVEAGFERPDGTLRHVLVDERDDHLIGIDLEESDVRVRGVGDELRVVTHSTRYHRGLPEDVVDRSTVSYILARLAAPGAVAVVLSIGLVLVHRRARPAD